MLRRLHFNLWYFFRPPWDSGISPPELLDFLAHHPPGRALDIGCGTGTNLVTLVHNGWQATGVDFAPRAVQLARRKLERTGLQADVSVEDATTLRSISGAFDLVLDLGCFHGVRDRIAYLRQLQRVLAPGAHWLLYARLLTDPTLDAFGLTPSDLHMIQASGLQLVSRQDSFGKRGRPSAWFLYQRPSPT
ncbi:MAG TPA: class I SAM-dependent methyltransferase [Anaerolineales bacterium]